MLISKSLKQVLLRNILLELHVHHGCLRAFFDCTLELTNELTVHFFLFLDFVSFVLENLEHLVNVLLVGVELL